MEAGDDFGLPVLLLNRLGKELLHQMFSLHLFGTPRGVSRFFVTVLCLCWLSFPSMADDVVVVSVTHSDFRAAHDALVEAIESEGLVVGSTLPFRAMLVRTAVAEGEVPYGEAEIIQFCSSGLASALVREAPEQLALCPLSIALYSMTEAPSEIRMAYRSPGDSTVARRRAGSLLQRIVQRAAELARLRW